MRNAVNILQSSYIGFDRIDQGSIAKVTSKILIDFLVFISIFNRVKTCKVKASTLHKNY